MVIVSEHIKLKISPNLFQYFLMTPKILKVMTPIEVLYKHQCSKDKQHSPAHWQYSILSSYKWPHLAS